MTSALEAMAQAYCAGLGDIWVNAFDTRQEQRVCKAPDGSFRGTNEPQKQDYIDATRAALQALANWYDEHEPGARYDVAPMLRDLAKNV